MSLNGFFCTTNSPKPKDSYHYVKWQEKQQIITFKKLKPANVWHFCQTNYWNDRSINRLTIADLIGALYQLVTPVHWSCMMFKTWNIHYQMEMFCFLCQFYTSSAICVETLRSPLEFKNSVGWKMFCSTLWVCKYRTSGKTVTLSGMPFPRDLQE